MFSLRNLPFHIGLILDGNRRWARLLGHSNPTPGHMAGAIKVLEFLSWCYKAKIKTVTLYLLSKDNLCQRQPVELLNLQKIIHDLCISVIQNANYAARHFGTTELLDLGLSTLLATLPPHRDKDAQHLGQCQPFQTTNQKPSAARKYKQNQTPMIVNLAIGYSGRGEIIEAVRSAAKEYAKNAKTIEQFAAELSQETISPHLYSANQPDLDLVIRTSGQQRLSDFMLWQAAHSELYFVESLGPDVREVDFLRALRDFAGRKRKYGA